MKLSHKLFIINVMNTLFLAAQANTIIRPATINDLDAIAEITRLTYYEHYKPFLKQMPAIINLQEDLDSLIEKKLKQSNNAAKQFIAKQQNGEPYGVLVVCNKQNNRIIGCCRFGKKDSATIYIYSLAINHNFQRIGLGTQLLSAVLNIFDDITTCKLRAFINNIQAHKFYKKYGFQSVGSVALDLVTGEIISDTSIPATHIDFQLSIQRQ